MKATFPGRLFSLFMVGGRVRGACAPPRKGRGTGPVGYKLFAVANDAGDNGRGRSERSERSSPGVAFPPAGC